MARLYEIDREIEACIDTETGEILDFERLNALQIEREDKIQGVALAIKNLLSDAEAIKQEKDALAERETACKKKAEGLKCWLVWALGGQKFSTAKCAVSFRKSVSTEITDANIVPDEFLVESVTVKPDLVAIKNALKSGVEVKGCKLVEKLNAQIK